MSSGTWRMSLGSWIGSCPVFGRRGGAMGDPQRSCKVTISSPDGSHRVYVFAKKLFGDKLFGNKLFICKHLETF